MPGSTGEPRGHAQLRLLPPPVPRRTTSDRTAAHERGAARALKASISKLGSFPVEWFCGLLLAIIASLLARAALLENLAPFHLALAAAVLNILPRQWRLLLLGAVFGRLLWSDWVAALFDFFILGGIYAATFSAAAGKKTLPTPGPKVLRITPAAKQIDRDGGGRPGIGFVTGGTALATLVGTGLYALLLEPNAAGALLTIFRTLAVTLLTALFYWALKPLKRLLHRPYKTLSGFLTAVADGDVALDLAQEEWLSGAVMAGALIAALQGFHIGPFAPAAIVAAGLILLFALRGGPGPGAAAGAAAGLLAILQMPGVMLPAAAYAVGGLLAGLFREFGIIGASGGYAIGIIVLTAFSLDPQLMVTELWSLLPAALLYGLVWVWHGRRSSRQLAAAEEKQLRAGVSSPQVNVQWTRAHQEDRVAAGAVVGSAPVDAQSIGAGPPDGVTPASAAEIPNERSSQLEQLGHLLRDMAATLSETGKGGSAVTPEPAAAADPANTSGPLSTDLSVKAPGQPIQQWLHRLAAEVCTGCHHHAACWEHEFFQTYQGLSDLIVRREITGQVKPHHLPARLRSRCPRQDRLVIGIDHAYEVLQMQRQGNLQLQLLRQLMSQQLEGLADVTRSLSNLAPTASSPVDAAAPFEGTGLPYRVGVARVAQNDGLVSGDSYLTRLVPGGQLALILSDGMGAGMLAARESRTAIDLLEKLLGLRLEPTLAIRLINQLLLARSVEDCYTTLDLVLVDLDMLQARFVKVGAPPSFLRQTDRVGVVRAGTPPIGILNDVLPAIAQRRLRRGDLIVMVTDGVLGAWSDIRVGEEWLQGFLRGLTRLQPRWVATQIVRQALRQAKGKVRDDMTVLAVKFL